MTNEIRFDDGAAYEQYMGVWSRLVGAEFLEWIAPEPAWRWLDVGCGNGAFTEQILARCAPSSIDGVDPSEAQIAYASHRHAGTPALRFQLGDAMALPFEDRVFDAAVMPLVIFFVPEPAVGVAEMRRVVRPGGLVTAYAWDMHGGGFPYHALQAALRALGKPVPGPPRPDASRREALTALWTEAGLEEVTTHEFVVRRTFADFDAYWNAVQGGPSVARALAALDDAERTRLQVVMRQHLGEEGPGGLSCFARANAVRGRVAVATAR